MVQSARTGRLFLGGRSGSRGPWSSLATGGAVGSTVTTTAIYTYPGNLDQP
ncbi:Putative membrane protein (plasmid) [Corynebacterium glyciniphilum AJ 3170]|uniref:Putative membrane protein n=1 Tax=Corynebacterium glyciniphilum AJ 3170 TaxID=1404245 RepID=X5DYQ8_9CORY|nr:Putative membrane protein [Corynebacterium glyciniphilum AJ 3170]